MSPSLNQLLITPVPKPKKVKKAPKAKQQAFVFEDAAGLNQRRAGVQPTPIPWLR
jgi:hypothetical protein